jgi:hypothetical protein
VLSLLLLAVACPFGLAAHAAMAPAIHTLAATSPTTDLSFLFMGRPPQAKGHRDRTASRARRCYHLLHGLHPFLDSSRIRSV